MRHELLTTRTLAVPAMALPLAALLAGCGSGTAPGAASSAPAAAPATATAAPPSPAPAQAKFVDDLVAALAARHLSVTEPDSQVIAAGEQVCTERQSGTAQSSVTSQAGASGALIVTLAERDLCPQYLPRVLIRLSGSGDEDSAPFEVSTGTVSVSYSYDCASFGQPGNFSVDLTDGSDLVPAR